MLNSLTDKNLTLSHPGSLVDKANSSLPDELFAHNEYPPLINLLILLSNLSHTDFEI